MFIYSQKASLVPVPVLLMALSKRSFWEQFFEQRVTPPDPNVQSEAGEWYVYLGSSILSILAHCAQLHLDKLSSVW